MSTTATKYRLIERAELKDLLDKKAPFQLWNTLTDEYYKADKNIAGSKRVPADKLTAKQAEELAPKKDELIVTYCGGTKCPSSKQAAEKLASLGYTNVAAYEGGLQDWVEAGLPLVSL